jgi:predicted transglutaminase-like cysteine proteinase
VRLFGTVEFRSPIKALPKWERVLSSESQSPSFSARGFDTRNEKVVQRWAKLKEQYTDAPLKEKMQVVNNFFNQWPYKYDMDIWGVEDYWAIPREFALKSGDCEDYAIAKYYGLRDLGVPAKSLRIAAVKDSIRGLGHAILVVFADADAYILDNLTNLVLSHKRLTHYVPQYTVNEEFLWRHVKPKSIPGKP